MPTPGYSWNKVPRKSVALFLSAIFLLFSTFGFISDTMALGREPALHLGISVLIGGVFAVLYAVSAFRLRRRWWMGMVPLFILQFGIEALLAIWIPVSRRPQQMGVTEIAQLQQRMRIDGILTIVAAVFAYICFFTFSLREGRRYFRVHAEMELAAQIHRVLVPPVAESLDGFEFYGRSQPSGEVGGDLIDVVPREGGWIAYISDVSGHGVAPGVVMGMVKSAARMKLTSGGISIELFPRLNAVLYPLKNPEMFVTMAYLAAHDGAMEYSLAGHPPILHYHAAGGEITQMECSNLPVGILEQSTFAVQPFDCAPGDVFVLVTDGLLEVENQAGEEFGLDGVKEVLAQHARRPLEQAWSAIMEAVKRHGAARDDQSLLLVRRIG